MYSGTTLTKLSGRVIGTHQKIDRVARRHLSQILEGGTFFPKIRNILRFEGKNGPDGIKRKSPAKDEPWHYYSPFDDDDSQLIHLIEDHYRLLVEELVADNKERAAFEAAWLAHAIVDGLTPAHHYPYEKELIDLSGGVPIEARTTLRKKLIMPGLTRKQQFLNNWRAWGPKGLRTAHGLFELGIATVMAPSSFGEAMPTRTETQSAKELGVIEIFRRAAREIAVLDMYNTYIEKGWTPRLAYQIRHKLGPTIVKTITLAWYLAAEEAAEMA